MHLVGASLRPTSLLSENTNQKPGSLLPSGRATAQPRLKRHNAEHCASSTWNMLLHVDMYALEPLLEFVWEGVKTHRGSGTRSEKVNVFRLSKPKTGHIKTECEKRVYWSAYVTDTYLSAMLGRPSVFHDEDIDQAPYNLNSLCECRLLTTLRSGAATTSRR